jgi:hypothetical protein
MFNGNGLVCGFIKIIMNKAYKTFFILLFFPFLSFAQNKHSKKYIDSSERQMKIFASQMYYAEQAYLADSTANLKSVDIFGRIYFEENNYAMEAFTTILQYAKKAAEMEFEYEGHKKCICYAASLKFFTSDSLDKKVKSLRKYLH